MPSAKRMDVHKWKFEGSENRYGENDRQADDKTLRKLAKILNSSKQEEILDFNCIVYEVFSFSFAKILFTTYVILIL